MSSEMTGGHASSLKEELSVCTKAAKSDLNSVSTASDLEAFRVQYLGKKGAVSALLKKLGTLPKEERPKFGQSVNELRDLVEGWISAKKSGLVGEKRQVALSEIIDVTLPGRSRGIGHKHPLTQVAEEVLSVLKGMGFELASGPEIEHDFFNFEALNVPPEHPARDMQDTFYIEDGVVLRTQTSPVQIRTMMALKDPPIRVVSCGRVFRKDQDATHSPIFHQIEGLYVDKQVTFASLKGTLESFVQKIFSPDTKMRLRPSFFPFTEPSCEVDISCFKCKGKGCGLCKGTGFIEILGAGMVDPEVFKSVSMDPEKVSGFAFGIGLERVCMLRYGIPDLRLFFENEAGFLNQF